MGNKPARVRQKGRPVSGWLILDKPPGLGSTKAVSRVKRLFDARKAGHGGTLDPFAAGLLPIAFGAATKTAGYVLHGLKTYCFTVRWGVMTDTLDPEGEVIARDATRPGAEEISAALPRFTGVIDQVPPAFSALKLDGERAYDLARRGEPVVLEARQVEITALSLITIRDADHAVLECRCGPGTYIRALARDLGQALGTVGMLSELRRTGVGRFGEADAISLDALEELGHNPPALDRHLLPLETALQDIPAMALSEVEAVRLRNGQPVSLLRKVDLERIAGLDDGAEVVALHDGMAVAIARYAKGEIRPLRVLSR